MVELLISIVLIGGVVLGMLAAVRTSVVASSTVFEAAQVETVLLAMGHTNESTWRQSPFHACLDTRTPIRRPLFDTTGARDFPILDDLEALGVTDYFVMPVQLPDPYVGAISIATARPGGFRPEKLRSFQATEPLIALGFAHHVVQQADVAVLAAYIGVDPARRVMAGAVQVGDSLELEAVIGFTDLRGFTRFSSESSSSEVVRKLTTFFSAVHTAVSNHGGEVLKFMGDGAMFVFPISERSKAEACTSALAMPVAISTSHALPADVVTTPHGSGLGLGLELDPACAPLPTELPASKLAATTAPSSSSSPTSSRKMVPPSARSKAPL